jgi:hypothetical protein
MRIHDVFSLRLFRTLLVAAISGMALVTYAAENPEEVDEVKLVGINLTEADVDTVRQHLWQIGGFTLARKSNGHNIDKFFTRSRLEDSYYLRFRYDPQGKVTSAYRLFRPQSTHQSNQRGPIQTKDVARELIRDIGQPSRTEYKTWSGMPGYHAYTWEGDALTIRVDRVGSDPLGPVFIEYTLDRDPYEVDPALALRQPRG